MTKLELFGHLVEIDSSGTGSIDPWTQDYANEHNIPLMGTTDIGYFVLIDGNHIYKIRNQYKFYKELELSDVTSWDDVMKILDKHMVDYFGTLEDSKKLIDGM